MGYDARYRMRSNSLLLGQNALAQYAYGHDVAGNITSILDATDSAYDRTFQYDDLNRLITATANTGAALWRRGSYTWDAMGTCCRSSWGRSKKVRPIRSMRYATGAIGCARRTMCLWPALRASLTTAPLPACWANTLGDVCHRI